MEQSQTQRAEIERSPQGSASSGEITMSMDFANQADAGGLVIRRPTNSDIAGLAAHFSEMQSHYNCPVSDAVAEEAAILACKPAINTFDPRVLIAVADNTVVGAVVMNVTFPASALTKALYIRDLYVAKAARRHRVGRMLVTAATQLAISEGFSAVEWTTDSANTAARRLYESCGARQVDRTYFSERRGVARPVPADRRKPRDLPG